MVTPANAVSITLRETPWACASRAMAARNPLKSPPHGAAQAGTTKSGEAAQVNTDFDTLYTLVNGNLDDANITALANIQQSKILNLSADLNTIRATKVGSAGILTFTGNGTWTKPSNLLFIDVIVIGGGGGGGSPVPTGVPGATRAGGGGSGGGYSRKLIAAVTLGATEVVTVGAGGIGGNNGQTGAQGVTSSFGSHLTATGGLGGSFSSFDNTIGIAQSGGGVGTNGLVNATGSDGQHGFASAANVVYGGNGGSSIMGGGGLGGVAGQVTPQAGKAYGGGGGGGLSDDSAALAGGDGGQGVVIVTEYRGA